MNAAWASRWWALGWLLVLSPELVLAQTLELGGSAEAEAEVASGEEPEVGVEASYGAELPAGEPEEAGAPPAPAAEAPASRPTSGPGKTHLVVQGDTLWGVSERYYRDPYQWPKLWSYNPNITNPHWIYPGHVLLLGTETHMPVGLSAGGSRRVVSRRAPSSVLLREQAYLDRDALQQSGKIIGSSASHMLLSVSDQAYVKFENPPAAPVGRELTVYRHVHERENRALASRAHDYDPEDPGEMVRVVGSVRVVAYDPGQRVATVEVVEALDAIERGYRITDVPRRYVEVASVTNQSQLETTVVAAVFPVEVLGQNQLVYLGAGQNAGVQAGNRLFVRRRFDGWRDTLPKPDEKMMGAERPAKELPDPEQFPWEILAEVLVLHVRPETSTALVTHAVREIKPGDQVEMRDGY